MIITRLPVAEASIAFDFPIGAVAVVASVALVGIAWMAVKDYRRTREQRRLDEGGVDNSEQ